MHELNFYFKLEIFELYYIFQKALALNEWLELNASYYGSESCILNIYAALFMFEIRKEIVWIVKY